MKIRQFDIWMADLNPRMGTEPGKVRPVVVVQSDLLNGGHPSTVICPITTQVQPDAEILRIHIVRPRLGLKEDSDIMIDQVRAIDNRRLIRKLGVLDESKRKHLRNSLTILFDLN